MCCSTEAAPLGGLRTRAAVLCLLERGGDISGVTAAVKRVCPLEIVCHEECSLGQMLRLVPLGTALLLCPYRTYSMKPDV